MALTYDALATVSVGSPTASIGFSNIDQTYTDLIIQVYGYVNTANNRLWMRFNGDSSGNYTFVSTAIIGGPDYGNNASISETACVVGGTPNNAWGTNDPAFNGTAIHIHNYSSTSFFKNAISRNLNSNNNTGMLFSTWFNTSAITSISFHGSVGGNFGTGTTATLYGIKKA